MKSIDEILSGHDVETIISELKNKTIYVPAWSLVLRDYEPKLHRIVTDHNNRRDRIRKDGTKENASRIHIGLEKLLTKRISEFTFAIPVKRNYGNIGDDKSKQQIVDAIEKVYRHAHINSENIKRGIAYYASCEICTVWYAVKKENDLYGFHSKYKLKCRTYSPMDGVELYPYFDEYGDMLAMSFYYEHEAYEGVYIEFFETYTATRHFKWKRASGNKGWEEVLRSTDGEGNEVAGEEIMLGKIPAVYMYRPRPVFDGLSYIREELEYTLSRHSDAVAYNAAPVLKIAGSVQGEERKGESKRIYRVENGGDVSYVSWAQSIEAVKFHVEQMLSLFFMQAQIPDISFDAMSKLGNIGYDARQTLLTDVHLKIGDESGNWYEFFERENNVIKAFLKLMNPEWASRMDDIDIQNKITPFIQNDEKSEITNRMSANGGKAIESQLESIQRFGRSRNSQETLAQIQKEEAAAQEKRINSLFEGAI